MYVADRNGGWGMTSKRVDKFAIRRRADAVTKERRTIERTDKPLRLNRGSPGAALGIVENNTLEDLATPAMVDPLPAPATGASRRKAEGNKSCRSLGGRGQGPVRAGSCSMGRPKPVSGAQESLL